MEQPQKNLILRFGDFELDLDSRELRRRGLRIHLQEQPFAILELLLKRSGEVVKRQEFQEHLWPGDLFVDFERGLNAGVTRLRQVLGETADRPRYFETVPRRGYRFVAPVSRLSGGTATPASPPQKGSLTRLFIAPFQQLQADEETAFLCFSLPDAIGSSLAGLPFLMVCSNRFASSSRIGDLRAIAVESDAEAVLTGTLLRSGSRLRVSAQLLRLPTGAVVWTHAAEVVMGDVFGLQDELTRRIVDSLAPSLGAGGRRAVQRDMPASARAYEFYLRGNHLSAQMRDLTLARDLYLACLDEDPEFAPAWVRIARCYRVLGKFRADAANNLARAEEAFQRAFALNPDLPGLHSAYAYHETEQGRAKEAIVRLVGQLHRNPNDRDLYAGLVHACRYAGLLDLSLVAHELACRVDRHVRTSVMNTHFVSGDYQRALEMSTDDVGFMDAMTLDSLGRRGEAIERVRRRDHLPPLMDRWMRMLEMYLGGRCEEAVEAIIEIDRQAVDPEGFFYRARILGRLGKISEALGTLELALRAGFYCAPAWRQDPYLEPVRGTARFGEMLSEVEEKSAEARIAFAEAGGESILKDLL